MNNALHIRCKILLTRIHIWILLIFNHYHKCITIIKYHIKWLEFLDDKRYYHDIAKANITIAKCYLVLGVPSSCVEHCYLAIDNYSTNRDFRIRRRAMQLRAKGYISLANVDKIHREKWIMAAMNDFCHHKELKKGLKISTGFRNNK